MGRRPCCVKEGLNKGPWSAREDKLLVNYITKHGEGKWRDLPQKAGLMRCGKSCRLRWLNYLRPGIKRGNISLEEEDLIIRLHRLLGNRWSLIAGRLPGRTDNEIKNYWNTCLSKRVGGNTNKSCKSNKMGHTASRNHPVKLNSAETAAEPHRVIRTKAVKCTKVVIPRRLELDNKQRPGFFSETPPSFAAQEEDNLAGLLMDFDISELLISDTLSSGPRQLKEINNKGVDRNEVEGDYYSFKNPPSSPVDCPDSAHEAKFENFLGAKAYENLWVSDPFQEILDLAFSLSSENEQIFPDAYVHSPCSMHAG